MTPSLTILGCGYVGGALAAVAAASGHPVTAVTRNLASAERLRAISGVRVVVATLADNDWQAAVGPPSDWVVNCVSAASPDAAGYRASYVDGNRSALAWLAQAADRPLTYVYTSSTSVYPQTDGSWVAEDDAAPVDDGPATRCLLRQAEELVLAAPPASAADRPLTHRHFVLRLAGIYGPGRHHLLDQVAQGVPVMGGNPDAYLNLIHRDDAVTAILAACRAAPAVRGGVFNIADGNPATKAQIVGWVAAELGVAPPQMDPAAARVRHNPFGGSATAPNRRIAVERARAVLGWQPQFTDFAAGYRPLLAVVRGVPGAGRA
jgi:nucleoside-diphosphate-sugar epimerase